MKAILSLTLLCLMSGITLSNLYISYDWNNGQGLVTSVLLISDKEVYWYELIYDVCSDKFKQSDKKMFVLTSPQNPDLSQNMDPDGDDDIEMEINYEYYLSEFVQFQLGDCVDGQFVPTQDSITYGDLNNYLTQKIDDQNKNI
jgi:hypothetical protein